MSLSASDTPIEETLFCAVALKTTGMFYFAGDRVLEIGAVKVLGGRISGIFRGDTAGGSASDAWARFADFIKGSVLVMHNTGFIPGFITSGLQRGGISIEDADVIDTKLLSAGVLELRNPSLREAAEAFGVTGRSAGRTFSEAAQTCRLFGSLLRRLRENGGGETLGEVLEAQGRRLHIPSYDPLAMPLDIEAYAREGKHLRIRYISKKGIASVRVILPLEVTAYKGSFYLLAIDRCGGKHNAYRTDRIKDARPEAG